MLFSKDQLKTGAIIGGVVVGGVAIALGLLFFREEAPTEDEGPRTREEMRRQAEERLADEDLEELERERNRMRQEAEEKLQEGEDLEETRGRLREEVLRDREGGEE